MNIENLLEAADYIESIHPRNFGMEVYREDDNHGTLHCGSVGCALGHLPEKFPGCVDYNSDGDIMFWELPYTIFGMEDDAAINYCFASEWSRIDDTPTGCANRLRTVAAVGEEEARKLWKQVCEDHEIQY